MTAIHAVAAPAARVAIAAILVAFPAAVAPAEGFEVAGLTVTPHLQSDAMRWRRPPDARLGARVELFLRNAGATPLRFAGADAVAFYGRRSADWVADGEWAWHDTPERWGDAGATVSPDGLTVLAFNTRTTAWGAGTTHGLSLAGGPERPVALARPDVWLSAVTFPGTDLATPPTRLVVHLANGSPAALRIASCTVWTAVDPKSPLAFVGTKAIRALEPFAADGVVPAGDRGGFVAACEPLPLTYGVVEVGIVHEDGRSESLWAHLRIKPEVFDISGGWVSDDVRGRSTLSLEPYLRTLSRMHVNTGHIGAVPGYTDSPDLSARYPLKLFNKLAPVERFDTDDVLPRVHAVEFLGEPQYGGGRPVPPQTVWNELAPYRGTRLPTTVTHSEERVWRDYAGLSDFPHFDAYRVTAPAADAWAAYDRWEGERIRWGAPLETIGDLTRSLRELNRPRPIAAWSQGAHAGWSRSWGRRRASPTPDELRAQALQALANRITSLYWFNLSLRSLVAFPDLVEPITRTGREARLVDRFLVEGDAYEYRRVSRDGRPDCDLNSVAAPDAVVVFVNDLAYRPDTSVGEFVFGTPREAEWELRLPPWLTSPEEVFRIDADGTADVAHGISGRALRLRDRAAVGAISVAARAPGTRAALEARRRALVAHEEATGFDPGRPAADRATLRGLLGGGDGSP